MATLLVPREQVRKMLTERIRAGEDVDAKAELAEKSWRHRDWLELFAEWRNVTIKALRNAYEGRDIAREFEAVTESSERSTPQYTFEYRRSATRYGLQKLESLVEGLELALSKSPDATAIDSLHPEILSRCRGLFDGGDYVEAVEKGFKVVRDRLRSLTGHETGSEAFGKGSLYVGGAAAPHVETDFQEGVKFLTMAIDRFRNEKSHTADENNSDPIRAYEYLRLSSLAMHLLDGARIRCRFSRPWDPCFSEAFHPGSLPRVTCSACLMSSSCVQSPFERDSRSACGACGRRGVRAVQGAVGNAERFPRIRQDPRASRVCAAPGGATGRPTWRSPIVGHPTRPFSRRGDSKMAWRGFRRWSAETRV